MNIQYVDSIKTPRTLVVILQDTITEEETTRTFSSTNPIYQRIGTALESKDYEAVVYLADPVLRAVDQLGTDASIKDGRITIDGLPIPPELDDEIRKAANAGVSIDPLKHFWRRLKDNPTPRSIQQAFRFVKTNGIHIMDDGRFIIYKGLSPVEGQPGIYQSFHDREFGYKLGEFATVDRNRCNDNPAQACGFGLHGAPWQYVHEIYGNGAIVALVCDPGDIVGVPDDHDWHKMRLCKVFPAHEVTEPLTESLVTTKTQGVVGRVIERIRDTVLTGKQATVSVATDRITLPSEFMNMAGFQKDSTVRAVITDPRARFILVHVHGAETATMHTTFAKEVKMLPSGAFSLRTALFRVAKIDGATRYHAKIVDAGRIEIRPEVGA